MNPTPFMDPELAAALALLEEVDPFDLQAHRDYQRNLWLAQDHERPGNIEIGYLDDRFSAAEAPPVRLRSYWNQDAPANAPVLIWLHGGGFALGFCELDDDLCTWISSHVGCHVVAPEYRLAPEDPFPAGFDDAYATLEWLSSNARELLIDPTRIAVGGASAGGALAASVCQRARDESGPLIAFQLLVYPVIDDRMKTHSMKMFVDTPIFDRPNAELMWERYLGDRRVNVPKYAAPGRAETLAGLPRAYVLTAEIDPLRDEGLDYARRLIEDGVETEAHHFAGAIHGFDTLASSALISQRAWQDYAYALRAALTR
jgi:acetyl esterase/lipase